MFKYINVKNIVNKQEKDINKLINDNDSKYRGQLFNLANKILEKNKVQIVLLSGPSCAGKTTTANLLKQILELKGVTVDVMSMDDFFIDLDKRKPLPNGQPDYDSPDIVNYELMNDCFTRYFKGEDVYFPEFDFKASKCVLNKNLHKYKYNSIVIFEGIHVLNPRLLKNLGTSKYFKIYVSPLASFKTDKEILTSKNLRLLRRTVRDIVRRGTSASKTKEIWPGVVEAEETYIEKYRNKVDYYINTTHEYELGVYKKEIKKFLEEGKIKPEEVLFNNFLDAVDEVDKSLIPDTSLMWEFVDKE